MKGVLFALLAAAAFASPAWAEQGDDMRYLLGASVAVGPEYDGASKVSAKLKPVWAVKFGRIRIASGGGSALLGFGRNAAGAGASTQFVETDKWRVGLSLRVDSGRDSGDADTTRGLPDVKRTLRARLYANYSLAADWNVGASLSQDVLGHKGGLTSSVDLGWRLYRSASTEWTSGIGLSASDAQNMRSYFGVPASAASSVGKPAYDPGAGLRDAYLYVGVRHAFNPHWFVFGSASASRLLGPAADSPLVQKPDNHTVSVGLAWRN
ncbi:MAG: MipA/OmpV family protein [Rubrivivax sp.]|nr:MAG: MipA/OmpV family protein [Rubrivivax sp.]